MQNTRNIQLAIRFNEEEVKLLKEVIEQTHSKTYVDMFIKSIIYYTDHHTNLDVSKLSNRRNDKKS